MYAVASKNVASSFHIDHYSSSFSVTNQSCLRELVLFVYVVSPSGVSHVVYIIFGVEETKPVVCCIYCPLVCSEL